MADAGSSLDAGHEKQKSQHGELRATGVGLGQLELPPQHHSFLCNLPPCL